MSDVTTVSNVATIKGVYDAFARGDVPAILGMMDPNISWTEAEGFPYAGTYSGPDAVLQGVFMPLGTEWDTAWSPRTSSTAAIRSSPPAPTAASTKPQVRVSRLPLPTSGL